MQARTAVAPVMRGEAPPNLRSQRPVLDRVRAFPPLAPGVEPAGRDVVATTERRDAVAFVLRDEVVDEGEAFARCAAQNRIAFFRRSCSSCSAAYLRSSAWSCASSRVTPAGAACGARPRSRPSFASFRHFDSMNGWIARAAATVCT